MIKEVRITRIEDLMPLLTDQEYREDLHRNRNNYLYRGMPDVNFRMETSLGRNCKHLAKRLEPAILETFAKYAVIGDPTIAESVWRQMILGQHYGLPTRLLDWTHSALTGLHFAVTETDMAEMDAHDCMVWQIDMDEMHAILPEDYRTLLNQKMSTIYSVDMLKEITGNSLEKYDADMGKDAMVVIEPPSVNTRIVNQYSFFSVVPMGMENVEDFLQEHTKNSVKYVIDRSLRWRVRDMLDQLNISERLLYPGLDGLSKWIARHYYVK